MNPDRVVICNQPFQVRNEAALSRATGVDLEDSQRTVLQE